MKKTYGMFSSKGNKLVAQQVKCLKEDEVLLPKDYLDFNGYRTYFEDIEREHPEVMDTDVREQILAELEREQ